MNIKTTALFHLMKLLYTTLFLTFALACHSATLRVEGTNGVITVIGKVTGVDTFNGRNGAVTLTSNDVAQTGFTSGAKVSPGTGLDATTNSGVITLRVTNSPTADYATEAGFAQYVVFVTNRVTYATNAANAETSQSLSSEVNNIAANGSGNFNNVEWDGNALWANGLGVGVTTLAGVSNSLTRAGSGSPMLWTDASKKIGVAMDDGSGFVTNVQVFDAGAGRFIGDGSSLTNLQSTNLVGQLGLGNLPGAVVTNSSSNTLIIHAPGRLGVGTDSPQQLIHVVNPSGAQNVSVIRLESSSGGYSGFQMWDGNEGNSWAVGHAWGYPSASPLVFSYGNVGGESMRAQVLTNGAIQCLGVEGSGDSTFTGSVGIGTTSPSAKLEVNGDAKVQNVSAAQGVSGHYLAIDGSWVVASDSSFRGNNATFSGSLTSSALQVTNDALAGVGSAANPSLGFWPVSGGGGKSGFYLGNGAGSDGAIGVSINGATKFFFVSSGLEMLTNSYIAFVNPGSAVYGTISEPRYFDIVVKSNLFTLGAITPTNGLLLPIKQLSYTGETNVTLDASQGQEFSLLLTNNAYITVTNLTAGVRGNWNLETMQDTNGQWSVTWNTEPTKQHFILPNGAVGVDTNANHVTVWNMKSGYYGTNLVMMNVITNAQ